MDIVRGPTLALVEAAIPGQIVEYHHQTVLALLAVVKTAELVLVWTPAHALPVGMAEQLIVQRILVKM